MPGPTVTALRLSPEQLTRTFNKPFSFASTAELQPLQGVLGQARAVQALQFGVSMPVPPAMPMVMTSLMVPPPVCRCFSPTFYHRRRAVAI